MSFDIQKDGAVLLRHLLILVIFAVITTICCELAHRASTKRMAGWFIKYPSAASANMGLVLALEGATAAATGSVYWATVVGFALPYIAACFSYFKYAARNEPLYVSDIKLFFAVFGVADGSNLALRTENMTPAVVVGLWFVCVAPAGEPLMPPVFRLLMLVMAAALVLAVIFIGIERHRPDHTYMQSGFLAGLLGNLLYHLQNKAAKGKRPAKTTDAPCPDKEMPDVVVVLSESFWDAKKLSKVNFSRDPIPFFRALSEESISGNLMVTPFGGGTCNVESEVLLGIVNRHFNITDSFYHSFIKRPTASLATAFRDKGYRATALHTFDRKFYARDKALALMGFEKFLAADSLTKPNRSGRYIDDSHLTDMIIETLGTKRKPQFVFAISMENHQPYKANKFKRTSITATSETAGFSAWKGAAEAYAHGLHDADRELERLVQFCREREKPTVVLFFGDHLGALGEDFALYRHSGLVSGPQGELSMQDIENVYTPPFVLWSNYKTETAHLGFMGANFLGNLLMDYVGLEKPPQFTCLEKMWARMRCLSREDYFLDAEGKVTQRLPHDAKALEQEYKAVSRRTLGI